MSTPETETQTEETFESIAQRIFRWIVDKVPAANNSEVAAIKNDIENLFTDPNAEPEPAADGNGYPVSYPVNGSPEEVRAWYANPDTTDAEIAQVNAARAAQG